MSVEPQTREQEQEVIDKSGDNINWCPSPRNVLKQGGGASSYVNVPGEFAATMDLDAGQSMRVGYSSGVVPTVVRGEAIIIRPYGEE